MNRPLSRIAIIICWILLILAGMVYYPKWKYNGTEATLSWDASGYYMYLPATFIYKDLRRLDFHREILDKYGPTPDFQQAFRHDSGNYVMKYASGQAFAYLPFFAIAHAYASLSPHEADGFSRPYQLMIAIGALIIALIGLIFLRKVLLRFFSDRTVAITLLLLVLGTNYLDYAGITGAMTHNLLFTLYSLLLWSTIRFYDRPTTWRAVAIGLLVGWMALIRPTEILSVLIPVLWGVEMPLRSAIRGKWSLIRSHSTKIIIAGLLAAAVIAIQPLYWKYVSGEWIVYSYQDQGFSWLSPHLKNGILSFRSGWLIYSPMMIFALAGFYQLFRHHSKLFWTALVFSALFIYVAFAWDEWWYGGSLGQRAMVQSYPLLCLPLAAFLQAAWKRRALRWVLIPVFGFFIYYNLWLHHQAHKGGMLRAGWMTEAYFWRIFLKNEADKEDLKLLDHRFDYRGRKKDARVLLSESFESDSSSVHCPLEAIEGKRSLCLTADRQYSREYAVPLANGDADWLRATATFRSEWKEWNTWKMTQFIVRFYNGEEVVRENIIRVFRILGDRETRIIHIDCPLPDKAFDRAAVLFWNAGSDKPIAIDNLKVEIFDEG